LLSACSFNFDWIERYRAQKAVGRQDYVSAVALFKKITDRDPNGRNALQAARQGATLAHLETKNYAQAIEFYKLIVLRSPDAEERKSAEKFIAQIDFDGLHNYDQAVVDYEKLLKIEHRPEEAFRYRLNLAKSHFYLNNIDQALNEIDVILSQSHSPDELFEAEVLKANTEVATKHLPEAASIWQTILKQFPEKATKENVALNLAVCYEDMKDFGRAIEVLEDMRQKSDQKEFLDLRIQRLKERMDNMPGAKGFKR
jgi:tetratricopeptide (TPR) repeat protein